MSATDGRNRYRRKPPRLRAAAGVVTSGTRQPRARAAEARAAEARAAEARA